MAHAPLAQEFERWPHTPEVTVRLGQGVPDERHMLRWLELEYTPVSEIGARKGVRVRVPP